MQIGMRLRNIKVGVSNLIKWFPIIWKDRDWDSVFLMVMLEKKLYNMSELHREHGHAENSEKIAGDLLELSELAGTISQEDYEERAFKGKEHLLNQIEVIFEDIKGSNMKRAVTYGLTDEEMGEFMRLAQYEETLLQYDIERLFNAMGRDLRTWWD